MIKSKYRQNLDVHYKKLEWPDHICYYCGDMATCLDHAYPLVAIAGMVPIDMLVKVPSCIECNSLAHSDVYQTLEEKRQAIRNKIAIRYRKILDMPDWSEEELDSVDGRMRQMLLDSIKMKKAVQLRLEFSIDSIQSWSE